MLITCFLLWRKKKQELGSHKCKEDRKVEIFVTRTVKDTGHSFYQNGIEMLVP